MAHPCLPVKRPFSLLKPCHAYRLALVAPPIRLAQRTPGPPRCLVSYYLLGGGARGSHGTERGAGGRAGQILVFSLCRYPVLWVCVRCFVVVERPFCQNCLTAVVLPIGSGRPARQGAPGPNTADGRTPPLTPRITRRRSSPRCVAATPRLSSRRSPRGLCRAHTCTSRPRAGLFGRLAPAPADGVDGHLLVSTPCFSVEGERGALNAPLHACVRGL